MTKKKVTENTLINLNAKKAEKELKAKMDFSANNAERAFAIMDEMEYNDTSLFDIVFGDDEEDDALNTNALDNLSKDDKKELFALRSKAMKAEKDKNMEVMDAIAQELSNKFPNLIDMSKAINIAKNKEKTDFLIMKILRLGGELTRELAKLYTKDKINNFVEAVEQARFYLMFLKNM